MKSACEIAVIGGGLSGLAAASVLNETKKDVLLLEAAPRLGGRIHSVSHPETGKPMADLGPTWVWPPYQPSISKWLEILGLELFPQYETGPAVLDLQVGVSPRHQPLPGQQGMARIANGPRALIDALSTQLMPEQVKLHHKLLSVSRKSGQFVLKLEDPDDVEITATSVIVCAPLRLMAQDVDWNGLLDAQTLAIMRAAPTWMAAQTKVSILYGRPFWREQGLSGRIASHLGPLSEVHDHCSSDGEFSALFGFVGWPDRYSDQDQLRAAIEEQLVRCFGAQASNFDGMEIQDWSADPLICSNLDRETPAQHPQVLPTVIKNGFHQNQLQFGVAETANDHPGLIDGALEAGERAARRLLSNSV